jgi:hypothetical protein
MKRSFLSVIAKHKLFLRFLPLSKRMALWTSLSVVAILIYCVQESPFYDKDQVKIELSLKQSMRNLAGVYIDTVGREVSVTVCRYLNTSIVTCTLALDNDTTVALSPSANLNDTITVKHTFNSLGLKNIRITTGLIENAMRADSLSLSIVGKSAYFVLSPASAAQKVEGDSVTFTAKAEGTPPLTLQWYKDSAAIAGAVNATYKIAPLTVGSAGAYYCVAGSPHGPDAVSASARLTVWPAPQAPQIDLTNTSDSIPVADTVRACDNGVKMVPLSAKDPVGTKPIAWSIKESNFPQPSWASIVKDTLKIGFPVNTEGNYFVLVTVDNGQKTAQIRIPIAVKDTTRPKKPDFVGNIPILTLNPKPTWSWKSGGDGAGMFRSEFSEGALQSAIEKKDTTYTPTADLPDNEYTLYVQERDNHGNWSEAASRTIKVDKTAEGMPVVTGPDLTNNPKPTWSWTTGGGANKYVFKLDNDAYPANAVSATTFTAAADLPEGPHIFYVKELDAAGNISPQAQITTTIDLTAPSRPKVSGTKLTKNLPLKWTWESGGSNDAAGYFQWKVNGKVFSDTTTGGLLTVFSQDSATSGAYTLYVREKDKTGNWSALDSFKTMFDNTKPNKPVITTPKPYTTDDTPTLTWTSGGGGGNGIYKLYFNNSASGQEIKGTSYTFADKLTPNTYVYGVSEMDSAGNESDQAKDTITIITVLDAPDVAVKGGRLTSSAKPQWCWGSKGGTKQYQVKLDIQSWTDNPDSCYIPSTALPAGWHKLYVKEKNFDDNYSPQGVDSVLIRTSHTKPVVKLECDTIGMERTVRNDILKWSWHSSDTAYCADSFKVSVLKDNAVFVQEIGQKDTLYQKSVTSAGTYTIQVKEKDVAGNWSDSAINTVVVDWSGPKPPSFTYKPLKTSNNPYPKWAWMSTCAWGAKSFEYKVYRMPGMACAAGAGAGEVSTWTNTTDTVFQPLANPNKQLWNCTWIFATRQLHKFRPNVFSEPAYDTVVINGAGNCSEFALTRNEPQVASNIVYTNKSVAKWTVSLEGGCPAKTLEYRMVSPSGGETWIPFTISQTGGYAQQTVTLSAEGMLIFQVRDPNNPSLIKGDTIYRDTQAPSVKVTKTYIYSWSTYVYWAFHWNLSDDVYSFSSDFLNPGFPCVQQNQYAWLIAHSDNCGLIKLAGGSQIRFAVIKVTDRAGNIGSDTVEVYYPDGNGNRPGCGAPLIYFISPTNGGNLSNEPTACP